MDDDWMSRAKCHQMDPALFFPSDGIGVQAAQRICASCTVRVPCLEFALANRISHGVWGGASERHRRRLVGQARRNGGSGAQVPMRAIPTTGAASR